MRKFFLVILLIASTAIYFAQCNIAGKSSIQVLETETYTLMSGNGQCVDCHLWVNLGGNTSIVGDNKQNSVKLTSNSAGRAVLTLSVLTNQGLVQCSKNIDIFNTLSGENISNQTVPKETVNCDIDISGFKEVKVTDGVVSFFPSSSDKEFKFEWIAIYGNGEEKQSKERVPQFSYSAENPISIVKLKVISPICIKNLSKSYEANYWKFFK